LEREIWRGESLAEVESSTLKRAPTCTSGSLAEGAAGMLPFTAVTAEPLGVE
jgi:hypothetical protein